MVFKQLIMGMMMNVYDRGKVSYMMDVAFTKRGGEWFMFPFLFVDEEFVFDDYCMVNLHNYIEDYSDNLRNLKNINTDADYSGYSQSFQMCEGIKNGAMLRIANSSGVDPSEVYIVTIRVETSNAVNGVPHYVVENGAVVSDAAITDTTQVVASVEDTHNLDIMLKGEAGFYFAEGTEIEEALQSERLQSELRTALLGYLTASVGVH